MTDQTTTPASTLRYSRGAIVFHWTIALLIGLNFAAAFVAEDLPKAEAMQLMGNHKALGITILLLSIGRVVWRLTHPAPPLLETYKGWEAKLAKATHALFYVLIIAVPVAGWGIHSAFSMGKPVNVFGIFAMPALPVPLGKPTGELFGEIHEIFAFAMLGLIVLHVLAALKHQFLDRDGTLRRMLPGIR